MPTALWGWQPVEVAALGSASSFDATVTTGEITYTGVIPTLTIVAAVDLTMVTGEITLTPVPLLLDFTQLTVPTGQITFTGVVPALDVEGIVWVAANATAPTNLPAVLFGFWETDTIRVRLYGTGFNYDQDTSVYAADLSDELPTAGGYTAGGKMLTGASLEVIAATNRTRLLADAVEWTGATFSAAFAAVIWDTGSDATSPILGVYDFNGLRSPEGDVFHVEAGADGWGIGIAA